MAWTAARTWVVGEIVTAAQLNTHVRDNLNAVARIVTGSYTGDGTTDRLIATDVEPAWVWVINETSAGTVTYWMAASPFGGGTIGPIFKTDASANEIATETSNSWRPSLATGGFTVSGNLNTSASVYRYVAIGPTRL